MSRLRFPLRVHLAAFMLLALFAAFIARAAGTGEADPLPVKWGAFVDTYYAYDFDQPPGHDRSYTTQAARNNEFNINLAYLDAKLQSERVRGRLAVQAGTSVQANYAGEPTVGQISGPSLSRNLQEAVIGYRVTDRLWIDGGVYFSHIGFESFISKENWTYTRSLMADFSPYYQSGVKATYLWSDRFTAQLHVLNGWQNVSENNGNKAVGLQLAYAPSERLSLFYNDFFGQEVGTRARFFNDLISKYVINDRLQAALTLDLGFQAGPEGTSTQAWQAYGAFLRYQVAPTVALTLREEQYLDRNQVIVATGTSDGFQTTGASVNVDVALGPELLWRSELRGLWSKDLVFPASSGNRASDGFCVTSLSLSY